MKFYKRPVFWITLLCVLIAAAAVTTAAVVVLHPDSFTGPGSSSSGSSSLSGSSSSSGASSSSVSSSSSISSVSPVGSLVYQNTQYGFDVTLPQSWKGFTVVQDTWSGTILDSSALTEAPKGPLISIRHPQWTNAVPRQDIPIMVFTIDQWNRLHNEEFSVGAAPVLPSEYGRNSKYVFALPARYNYSYLPGWEEVDAIITGKPLHPFNVTG